MMDRLDTSGAFDVLHAAKAGETVWVDIRRTKPVGWPPPPPEGQSQAVVESRQERGENVLLRLRASEGWSYDCLLSLRTREAVLIGYEHATDNELPSGFQWGRDLPEERG